MGQIPENIQKRIEEIREKCSSIKPRVAIHSLAYNHGPYIKDALEGFVKQTTNFPVVAIVHEDASTDNTAVILREYAEKYPDIILPIFEKENQYSKPDGSLGDIMNSAIEATGAEYIAMCECDDYWIDPLKLQKQVNFLGSHPDYGLVHTNYNRLNQSSGQIKKKFGNKYTIENGYVFETLVKNRFIKTLTVLFRASLISNLPELPNGAFSGDAYIFYEIALKSKIHYINESMCMYRLLAESASHSRNADVILNAWKSYEVLDLFYLNRAKSSINTIKEILQKWTVLRLKLFISENRYNEFVEGKKRLSKPIKISPTLFVIYISKYKFIFYLISKLWQIKKRLIRM